MTARADIARLLDLRSGFTRDDLILDGKGSEVQLGRALTDAQVERTMEGASTVTLTVADSDWSLAGASELLGEKRLKSDLNLEIDDLVFTLNELEKIDDGWSMVFYDEPTTALRDHKRRMKATRDTVTRAQFFGMLCKAAGVRLYSIEKNVKQPVAALDKADAKQLRDSKKAVKTATQKAREKKAAKVPAKEARVYKRLKGPASWFGRVSAQGAIDPGDPSGQTKSGKPNYAKGVAVNAYPSQGYAGAVRSYNEFQGSWWRCTCPNGRVGVFQHIDQGPNADGRVVDFTASALADIGYTVLNFPTSAGTFHLENLGRAYGDKTGAVGSTSTTSSSSATTERARIAKYEFAVDTGEDYQETGQRLADEVGWRCFSNGTGYVFDSDLTLAKADPSVVLQSGDDGVDRIRWTWTRRALIDELQVDIRLVPWAAPPGAVALVKGEGPADGKWLVRSIQAPLLGEDRQATVTLGRPQKPLKEPAPSVETVRTKNATAAGSGKKGTVTYAGGVPHSLNAPVLDFLERMAGVLGFPVIVTTSTNHDRLTVNGTVSDHYAGNAADLGIGPDIRGGGNDAGAHKGNQYASAALQVLGKGKREADRMAQSGRGTDFTNPHNYSWQGHAVQVGWRTDTGGNHFTHVHIGVAP